MSHETLKPLMEIRERFIPSEPLGSALNELLQPPFAAEDSARLRASFLFQSYRRRLKTQEDYLANEHNRRGQIHTATKEFAELPPYKLALMNPEFDLNKGHPQVLIHFTAQPTPNNQLALKKFNSILSGIRTIEQESIRATLGKHFFVTVQKAMLGRDFFEKFEDFQDAAKHAEPTGAFYIEPDALITRTGETYQSEPQGAA